MSCLPFGPTGRSWFRLFTVCHSADVLKRYEGLVQSGKLKPDQNQQSCAQQFQGLLQQLSRYTPAVSSHEAEAASYRQKRRELTQQFADREREEAEPTG